MGASLNDSVYLFLMYRVELKGIDKEKAFEINSWFLMYRVELKVEWSKTSRLTLDGS